MKQATYIEQTIERAFLIAQKENVEINESNYEPFFIAALGQEEQIINQLLKTQNGQKVTEIMCDRVYSKLN